MAEEKKLVKRPTAKKREIQDKKRNLRNKSFKSKIKTAVRSFKNSLKNEDVAIKKETLNLIFSLADKGCKKKILKKNKANRLKSKMSLLLSKKD